MISSLAAFDARKKKPGMTPEEQSEALKREVQRLIDAGELKPIEAEAEMKRIIVSTVTPKHYENGRAEPLSSAEKIA